MASESETIIAFIFKRSGKEELSFSEFYLSLSIDLNWFSPKQAKELIKESVEKKLLTKKGDLLKPNFDVNNISIPVGFYPTKQVFEEKKEKKPVLEEDVLNKIIKTIVKKTNLSEKKVIEKIQQLEKNKNITSEVAALLIGKEHNIPFDDYLDEIEEKIFI